MLETESFEGVIDVSVVCKKALPCFDSDFSTAVIMGKCYGNESGTLHCCGGKLLFGEI